MHRVLRSVVVGLCVACAPTKESVRAEPTSPGEPPPPSPVTPREYLPLEALDDARSGPLELVGIGGWPGTFRRLTCVYRNARVIVIDERCSTPREPNGLMVHVVSPGRGRVSVFAEAGGPIGAATRAAYTSFGVVSREPRPAPATLSLSARYDDVIAYESVPAGRGPPECLARAPSGAPSCSKGSTINPGAFAATVQPFLNEPPAAWFELVRTLVTLRQTAHASISLSAFSPAQLAAWSASWARDQDLTVDEDHVARVGNTEGLTASTVMTADGGAFIAGTKAHQGATIPFLVRVDARGRQVWSVPLPERGFVSYEAVSVLATPDDGAVVLAQGYPNPAWKAVHRVLKLDGKGAVRWQWIGRGKDKHQVPQIVTGQLTTGSTVVLRGLIQLVADGDVHAWTGALDTTGKLVRDEVGPVLPDHGASVR